jgi:tetratricopeptide (TPR) repeat protein
MFDFKLYEQQPEDRQRQMVSEFIENRIKHDPAANTLRGQFAAETSVVPVALDLGMLQLQRAQGLAGDDRKAELERAEKTFLAIRNVASDAPGYKLSLGTVYYWLGKLEEGKKIFDEVLAAAADDFQQRAAVAMTLRDVGAESEARALSETLYASPIKPDEKMHVARMRAAMCKDLEDEIVWLGRASQTDPEVKASLNQAKGRKALADGNQEEGIRLLRLAGEAYAAMPESSTTLNNGALCYQVIFQASGQRRDLDEAGRLLDKGAALQPDDSILTTNAGQVNLTRALAEILEPHVHLEALTLDSGLDLVRYLYDDADGRQPILDQLKSSPALARAVQLLERSILLAPKRAENYDGLVDLYTYLDDAEGLKRLLLRIEEVDPDVSRIRNNAIESAQGKKGGEPQAAENSEENCRRLYDR